MVEHHSVGKSDKQARRVIAMLISIDFKCANVANGTYTHTHTALI